jgi:peptidoglycan/LPS O-acetylase OafA/YrhL
MPEEVRANAGSKETHETRSVVGRFLRRRLPFLVVVLLLAVLGVLLFVIELPPDVGRAIHAYFNYGEALFWGIAGVCVFRRSRKQPPASRSAGSVAAVAFIAFGVSDLIEIRTGTWYDPWWLFAWKATCVVTLVSCLLVHVRRSGKAPFSG